MSTAKTKIIKIKGDWQEVVNDCRITVGKQPYDAFNALFYGKSTEE